MVIVELLSLLDNNIHPIGPVPLENQCLYQVSRHPIHYPGDLLTRKGSQILMLALHSNKNQISYVERVSS